MPRKPASKHDDPEQSKRFIETAKEVGADEDAGALERAFGEIVKRKSPVNRRTDSKTTSDRNGQ